MTVAFRDDHVFIIGKTYIMYDVSQCHGSALQAFAQCLCNAPSIQLFHFPVYYRPLHYLTSYCSAYCKEPHHESGSRSSLPNSSMKGRNLKVDSNLQLFIVPHASLSPVVECFAHKGQGFLAFSHCRTIASLCDPGFLPAGDPRRWTTPRIPDSKSSRMFLNSR